MKISLPIKNMKPYFLLSSMHYFHATEHKGGTNTQHSAFLQGFLDGELIFQPKNLQNHVLCIIMHTIPREDPVPAGSFAPSRTLLVISGYIHSI